MGWRHRIAYSALSSGFANALKSEMRCLPARLQCFLPSNLFRIQKARRAPVKCLNVGAGSHQRQGWYSIDLVHPGVDIRWDVRWGLPFRSDTVERIHCEHFLEHLEYPRETKSFLGECYRILKPGGELRLIVPDAEKYIQAYVRRDLAFWKNLSDLGGTPVPFETEIEIMNQAFRMGGEHLFAFDSKTLRLVLSNAGFSKIELGDFSSLYLDQHDAWRRVESLYLTARKSNSVLAKAA